jgi:hypothetical protein
MALKKSEDQKLEEELDLLDGTTTPIVGKDKDLTPVKMQTRGRNRKTKADREPKQEEDVNRVKTRD